VNHGFAALPEHSGVFCCRLRWGHHCSHCLLGRSSVAGDLDSSVSVDQFFYQAITAVPPYEDKSFEELRLDDYLAGNKGMKCEDKKILLAKEV